MKKLLSALAVIGTAAVGLAEESASSGGPDFSAATTALTGVQSALGDWVGDAMPILATIASAFLVFWLGKMIFRLVKGWASSAK